jgi:hypothetical protein
MAARFVNDHRYDPAISFVRYDPSAVFDIVPACAFTHEYKLPADSGTLTKSMIRFAPPNPDYAVSVDPIEDAIDRSSTDDERVATFLLAREIAKAKKALFSCTQLGCVEEKVKEKIMNTATDIDVYGDSVLALMNGLKRKDEDDYFSYLDTVREAFAIDALAEFALEFLGHKEACLVAKSSFVPMHKNAKGECTFLAPAPAPAAAAQPDVLVRIPVVYMEPLRLMTTQQHTGRYEQQQMIIADDALIIPYYEYTTPKDYVREVAMARANRLGVDYIHHVIFWDVKDQDLSCASAF